MTVRHYREPKAVHPREMWGAWHAYALINGHPATDQDGTVILEVAIADEFDAFCEPLRVSRGEGAPSTVQLAAEAFPSLNRRQFKAAWTYHNLRHRCRILDAQPLNPNRRPGKKLP